MAERVLSQVQAAQMGFLRRVHGVTLRDKVRSSEFPKTLNIDQFLFRIDRSQCRCFHRVTIMSQELWQGKFCWLHPRESCPEVHQGPGGMITSPASLGRSLY